MKKIKIKYTNLAVLIIIIYILIQIIMWFLGYFTKTLVIDSEEVNLKVNKKGLVVMDESLIKSNQNGIVDYTVSDGEKIKKDKMIFTVSQVKENTKITSQIKSLKNEIEKLEQQDKSINSQIIKNKKEKLKILQNKQKNYSTSYSSNTSGIISFEYDNYSENLKVDDIKNIDLKTFEKIENNFLKINHKQHKVNSSDVLIRIINPNDVYICIFSNEDIFKINKNLSILINGNEISAKVYKKYDDYVVIKIMEQNMLIYSTRIKEFDIIYEKIEAFKIPISSIVTNKGNSGVYVIDEETLMPKFVKIDKNYYKDEKYLYVDYNKNKEDNNLKLYDRILLYPNIINKNIKVSR